MILWVSHLRVQLVSPGLIHTSTLHDGWKGQDGRLHVSGDWRWLWARCLCSPSTGVSAPSGLDRFPYRAAGPGQGSKRASPGALASHFLMSYRSEQVAWPSHVGGGRGLSFHFLGEEWQSICGHF